MNDGQLQAIWIKRTKLGPMDPAETAQLVAGRTDYRGPPRQVTIHAGFHFHLQHRLNPLLGPDVAVASCAMHVRRRVPSASPSFTPRQGRAPTWAGARPNEHPAGDVSPPRADQRP